MASREEELKVKNYKIEWFFNTVLLDCFLILIPDLEIQNPKIPQNVVLWYTDGLSGIEEKVFGCE